MVGLEIDDWVEYWYVVDVVVGEFGEVFFKFFCFDL